MIELTAVACAASAAPDGPAAPLWPASEAGADLAAGPRDAQEGPRRSAEEHTAAASGLLAALAASASPADEHLGQRGDKWRSISAQPVRECSSSESLCEGTCQGPGQLLPAWTARSHHSLALLPYRPLPGGTETHSPVPPRSQPSGGSALPGGNPRSGGAEDAGTGAYLSDRRQLAVRLAPWGCMLAVVAGTRAAYLQHSNGQELTLHLRSLGDLTVSSNLVISFHDLCR